MGGDASCAAATRSPCHPPCFLTRLPIFQLLTTSYVIWGLVESKMESTREAGPSCADNLIDQIHSGLLVLISRAPWRQSDITDPGPRWVIVGLSSLRCHGLNRMLISTCELWQDSELPQALPSHDPIHSACKHLWKFLSSGCIYIYLNQFSQPGYFAFRKELCTEL